MNGYQKKNLFSNSENAIQWDYTRNEVDARSHIKVTPLTPEMQKNNKEIVDEMFLLFKDYLGLLSEEEQQLLKGKKA
jgi:hypothetical protein